MSTVEAVERWARSHLRGRARALAHRLYDRRRIRVSERIRETCGGRVQRGPFAGMVYPFATRHAGAKCIGSYESELHAAIEQVVRRGYAIVVNLGCAEGYYAVGLARRMPTSTVVAVDYNPQALGLCRRLADANGLAKGRIRYAPEATHALGQLSAGDAFVLADVEGAELSILDPVELPNLLEADLLVELHEHATPGIETILRRRFAASHHIAAIDSKPRDPAVGVAELHGLSMRLRALALSERPTATRWLVMRAWSNLPP